jgi:hypothetical protein
MGLPVPESSDEFMEGTEGGLVFLNKYGLVMRIEAIIPGNCFCTPERVNDSGWVLQPLASLEAGLAMVELCPGTHLERHYSNSERLRDQLRRERIDFWDDGTRNCGVLPVKTLRFPEGVTVVIDRLAVKRLSQSTAPIAQAFKEEAQEAAAAQEKLYAPLREALKAALPDARKMKQFWELCESYVRDGKLVSGWNEADGKDINIYGEPSKPHIAMEVAKCYENKFKPG